MSKRIPLLQVPGICSPVLLFLFLISAQIIKAQPDTTGQKDLFDLLGKISPYLDIEHEDSVPLQPGRIHFSALPVIGYALQTGMVGGVTGNAAFYTGKDNRAKISNTVATLAYTQKNQVIFIFQPNIWTRGNKYNITGDVLYLKYPQETFGLGSTSSLAEADHVDYSYLRFYQTLLRQLYDDLFAGVGYDLDYHWNIQEHAVGPGSTTDFLNYEFHPTSVSSGITLNLLFDNRKSSINPQGGVYGNVVFRTNSSLLGSDQNWNSLLIDCRKYIRLSARSNNVLAFWSLNWLTLNGTPPYLDLPSTGWDNYGNTGRGYIQGRFRGKNMIYLESEYRFGITTNGLLGGVVFLNAESFSGWPSNTLEQIQPGYGAGIRIKANKYSNTNIALDYGFGTGGSRGLFVNLCEMF